MDSMDSPIDVVFSTQDSQASLHVEPNVVRPMKILARRSQLPNPFLTGTYSQNHQHEGYVPPMSQYPIPPLSAFPTAHSIAALNLNPQPPYISSSLPSAKVIPSTKSQPAIPSTKSQLAKTQRASAKKGKGDVAGNGEEKVDAPSKFARWEDKWTVALIHIRCEMQDEFSKPPKQGVNLWSAVYTKLVAACPDFDKDHQACRKKWKALWTEYMADKAHNVSGNNRFEECQYYNLIDEYMANRANVRKYMANRANVRKAVHGGSIADSRESSVKLEGEEVEEKPCVAKRRDVGRKKNIILQEIKDGRKEFLGQMAHMASLEERKVTLLERMKVSVSKLADKL